MIGIALLAAALAQAPDAACARAKADVVMSDVSDPMAFRNALVATPDGGVLLIRPGTYVVTAKTVPFLSGRRKGITICGEADSHGKRPTLKGDPQAKPNSMIPWRATNGDITIENLEIAGVGGSAIFAGTGIYAPHAQKISLRNVFVHDIGGYCLVVGLEKNTSRDALQPTWNDDVLIEGSEFARCAQSHNVYIDRVRSARFIRSKTYDPGPLHALKIIAYDVTILDSEISNVSLDGSVNSEPPHPRSVRWHGMTPLSLVAGQRGIVRGNRIVFRFAESISGTVAAMRQHRHAIQGHDDPPYFPAPWQGASPSSLSDFWKPEFWSAVKAAGLGLEGAKRASPYLLPMYWSRNRFEVYAWPRGSKPTGIVNQGSYPNEPVKQGSDMVRPLPIPPGWAERSYDFLYEGDGPDANTWIGDWQKQGVLEGPAMVDSAGKIVNPGQRVFEVTGPLPPWFCVVGPPAAGESAAPPDGRGASAAETRRPPPKPSSSRCAW